MREKKDEEEKGGGGREKDTHRQTKRNTQREREQIHLGDAICIHLG